MLLPLGDTYAKILYDQQTSMQTQIQGHCHVILGHTGARPVEICMGLRVMFGIYKLKEYLHAKYQSTKLFLLQQN